MRMWKLNNHVPCCAISPWKEGEGKSFTSEKIMSFRIRMQDFSWYFFIIAAGSRRIKNLRCLIINEVVKSSLSLTLSRAVDSLGFVVFLRVVRLFLKLQSSSSSSLYLNFFSEQAIKRSKSSPKVLHYHIFVSAKLLNCVALGALI